MLQAIRNRAQGWIAWVIVILITIPFALFGIQEYLGVSADPVVAVVDDAEIQQSALARRVQGFRENMRRSLGANYRADLFDEAFLQQQVLQSMVSEKVLEQATARWNMQASDAQIRQAIQAIPALQRDGVFDPALYRITLRNQGLTSAFFEQQVRQDLILRQFEQGWQAGHFVTEQAVAEDIRLREQQRAIQYAQIPPVTPDLAAVTAEQIQAYYQQHPAEYQVPERIKLAYLQLSATTLSEKVTVDETALRKYFDEHAAEFIPAEERKLRHILLSTGDEAAQLAQANKLYAELQAGADFAELAKVHSADTGSATEGGALGWMSRDALVPPFAESAFTLAKQAISEPVKTQFGYHLIQVEAIRGGGAPDFAAQRAKVETAYRQQQAEQRYYDDFERLTDLVYENPDSLAAAAEFLGIPVQKTDWLERTSVFPAPLDAEKIKNAAFSEEVLQGNNSDLIERGPADAVVVRVTAHEPATRKPLDAVKESVTTQVAANQAQEQTQQQGTAALQKLRAGADFAALAQDWSLTAVQRIGRQANEVPPEVVQAAFAAPRPAADTVGYTGAMAGQAEGYYVIAVEQVIAGDVKALDAAALQKRRTDLENQQRDAEYRRLRQGLRAQAEVEIK